MASGEVTKFWTNTRAHAGRNKQRLGNKPIGEKH